MRTLVLGIGNSILGDDGVGVRVAREVAARVKDGDVDVRDVSVDGLNLFDFILGYDKLVVIDAIVTEDGAVGDVFRIVPEKVCDPSRSAISPHHFNLATTIEIGKELFPDRIPRDVVLYAVATEEATAVSEEMTREVEQAVPRAVDLVMEEIGLASLAGTDN
jgi:hydrogenase maturation protease